MGRALLGRRGFLDPALEQVGPEDGASWDDQKFEAEGAFHRSGVDGLSSSKGKDEAKHETNEKVETQERKKKRNHENLRKKTRC